jgi:hypothetical protein
MSLPILFLLSELRGFDDKTQTWESLLQGCDQELRDALMLHADGVGIDAMA